MTNSILLTAVLGFLSGAVAPIASAIIQKKKKKSIDIEITEKVRSVYGSIIDDIKKQMEQLKLDVAYWKDKRCDRDECKLRIPTKKTTT